MKTSRIREYAKLIRIEYLGFSCVCVMGALAAVGRDLQIQDGILLFLIHMFSIVWGFVHNDYCDVRYDSTSDILHERPLVKGSLSKGEALVIVGLSLGLVLGLAFLFYGRTLPMVILIASAPLAAIYNLTSKKVPGSDLFFASSAALLCLFGAVAVLDSKVDTSDIMPLVWILVAIQFIDHLFFNLTGGLKDLAIDHKSGARTTPIAMGVRIMGNEDLVIPPAFKTLMMGLKLLTIGLVFAPFLWLDFPFHPLQMGALCAMAVLAIMRTHQLTHTTVFDRKAIAFLIIKQENACKVLVPLLLVSHIGIYWFLFFLIAPVWFMVFNAWVNGKAFQPPQTY